MNYILEFSVKSEKHSASTLSLVQNQVRLKKKPAKKYISLQGGETPKHTILFYFCGKLSFILF
jgi:hypothetical protein